MKKKMECHCLSDAGKVREVNEDQFLFADLNKSMLIHQTSLSMDDHTRLMGESQGQLLVVADGMGGHAAGQQASRIAIDAMVRHVLNTLPWFLRLQASREDDLAEDLKAAMERCQERIEAEAEANPQRRKMGTTLTMAYIVWPRLYVVHAGDSRCYLRRQGKLAQITTDHTLAQQMVVKGVLQPEEAGKSQWSHVLWNCLGGGTHELRPEVRKATLQVGDTLLLCTDGLTNGVSDDRLAELLGQDSSAAEACRRLVAAANDAGGRDNVTVVVARFRSQEEVQAQQATLEEMEAALKEMADTAVMSPLSLPPAAVAQRLASAAFSAPDRMEPGLLRLVADRPLLCVGP